MDRRQVIDDRLGESLVARLKEIELLWNTKVLRSRFTSNSPSIWFAIEREVTLGVQTQRREARAIVARGARRT